MDILFYKDITLVILYVIITLINIICFIRSPNVFFMFDNISSFMDYTLYIIILTLLLIEINYIGLLFVPVGLTIVVLIKIGQKVHAQHTNGI